MENNKKSFYYPPGGILIWILVVIEVLTFIIAVSFFNYEKRLNAELFNESQKHLSKILGTINTIVLISSGFFAARSLFYLKNSNLLFSKINLFLSILLGFTFIMIKSIEYYYKLSNGYSITYNSFFNYYWLLTIFHLVHVLFGLGLLIYMYNAINNNKYNSSNYYDFETSTIFWHMCDLIWIIIFPTLYLL